MKLLKLDLFHLLCRQYRAGSHCYP